MGVVTSLACESIPGTIQSTRSMAPLQEGLVPLVSRSGARRLWRFSAHALAASHKWPLVGGDLPRRATSSPAATPTSDPTGADGNDPGCGAKLIRAQGECIPRVLVGRYFAV